MNRKVKVIVFIASMALTLIGLKIARHHYGFRNNGMEQCKSANACESNNKQNWTHDAACEPR